MSYPSPCDTCQNPCDGGSGCDAWRIRYRYRQKQINAYAMRLYKNAALAVTTTFRYPHPGETRRYLHTGPCPGCNAEDLCNTPCPRYLHWWDMRMELARKKAQL